MKKRTLLFIPAKPGAGKGTLITNFLKLFIASDKVVVISSGTIMAQLPAAQKYYLAQKPVPARVYYPAMLEEMSKKVLPSHELAIVEGAWRYEKDVDKLCTKSFLELFDSKIMIELVHGDTNSLVERLRSRGRADFSPRKARWRIGDYARHRDSVILALRKKGFNYGYVDATADPVAVVTEFFNVFSCLRSGRIAAANAA